MKSPQAIGILAGGGALPRCVWEKLRRDGSRVVVIAHTGEVDPASLDADLPVHWVRVGQLGRIASIVSDEKLDAITFAGWIRKQRLLRTFRPDWAGARLLASLAWRGDDAILRAVSAFFAERSIQVIAPTSLVPELLAPVGDLAPQPLSAAQLTDARIGWQALDQLGALDVGQAIAVSQGVIIAVEGIEGTDGMIRRAGALTPRGCVIVKRAKSGQDTRFDLPTIGPETIATMAAVGARALVIEAAKTIVINSDAVATLAMRHGITVSSWEAPPS